jgi:hypothetical protein
MNAQLQLRHTALTPDTEKRRVHHYPSVSNSNTVPQNTFEHSLMLVRQHDDANPFSTCTKNLNSKLGPVSVHALAGSGFGYFSEAEAYLWSVVSKLLFCFVSNQY